MKAKPLPIVERTPGRICWSCQYLYFSPGAPGYSELTPGWAFELNCAKDYWSFDSEGDELPEFRRKLMSAERCGDFEPHEPTSAQS